MNQDVPPGHRIVEPGWHMFCYIGLFKLDVVVACRTNAPLGNFQRRGIQIKAVHVAVRPYKARRNQGDFTDATAQIEYPHACGNPGTTKKTIRERIEHSSL
jgi:hypothetical protein